MPQAALDNLIVVLVEPQGERNVGAVCRAMANFGLTRLRLVNPQTDHLVHEARQMAVKATDILEAAAIVPTLGEAVADCHLAAGTTRRFGKYREGLKLLDTAAPELVNAAGQGRVALVFGREDAGLKTEELDLCQVFVTIPTDERLPSMNLAQAVALTLYELSRAARPAAATKVRRLAPVEAQEALYEHMRGTLLDIGFLNPQNPDHILRTLRRVYGRAGLDAREVSVLRGMLSCMDQVVARARRRQEPTP